MTYEQFVTELARRLQEAGRRPMQDGPAIEAAIQWAINILKGSGWSAAQVREFIRDVGLELGAVDEIDPATGRTIKKAQSNTAFLALMAKADLLAQSAKGSK